MDTKVAILALMSVWGIDLCAATPALALDAEATAQGTESVNPLLNRVWVRSSTESGLPGAMQIFLADGTLVSDSCWEAYRLSKWQQVSATTISWDEDGMTIAAEIASLSPSELVLKLVSGKQVEEQRFVAASART